MKRAHRIVLIIVVIVAAVGIMAYGGLSAVLSRVATREINKVLAKLPEGESLIRLTALRHALIEHAAVTLPDGSMKMETRDIAHRDQGELRIGASPNSRRPSARLLKKYPPLPRCKFVDC